MLYKYLIFMSNTHRKWISIFKKFLGIIKFSFSNFEQNLPPNIRKLVTVCFKIFLLVYHILIDVFIHDQGFPCGSAGKESACSVGDLGLSPEVRSSPGKIPWRRERLLTPIFWFREFHGLYGPLGRKQMDLYEQLSHAWAVLRL